MRVAVTGASGLIGSALVPALRAQGHDVVRLVRRRPQRDDERTWDPDQRRVPPQGLAGVDAVVHLAGAPVFRFPRWTARHKKAVLASRVDGTTAIAQAAADSGVSVLLSASGAGYYGDTGDRWTTEKAHPGKGFLADVTRAWEASTRPAEDAGLRVAHLRSGIVLSDRGGALPPQLRVFRLGLGAPLGTGQQYVPWIALEDEVRAIVHCLDRDDVRGPVNLAAPNPVTNREFTRTLGRVLHRPTLPVPVPAFALRAGLGEFADEGLLIGQRLAPSVLLSTGFAFRHPGLDDALRTALGQPATDAIRQPSDVRSSST